MVKIPKYLLVNHLKLMYTVSNWSFSFLLSILIIFNLKKSKFTSFEEVFIKSKSVVGRS